jgi:TIGR00255 family protein
MIKSMTGFGAAEGMLGNAQASVEVRTVNHRFFTPAIKLPNAYSRWEGEVRDLLRNRIARGHVSLYARLGSEEKTASIAIDEARFAAYLAALRDLKQRHSIPGDVDIASVLRLPNLLSLPAENEDTGSVDQLIAIVSSAVDDLVSMREAEGVQLARYLEERLKELSKILARVAERAPLRLKEQHARLRETVAALVADHAVDDQRIAHEVAILAEKLDVEEELDRFNTHIAAFAKTVRTDKGEPAGKRLGFLLQEMVREANTLGSKANDSPILSDVILIKEELERMREQVENVE